MRAGFKDFLTHLRNLYLGNRFFGVLAVAVVVSALGFQFPPLFYAAVVLVIVLLGLTAADALRLYRQSSRITGWRNPPQVLSLGDEMRVGIRIRHGGSADLRVTVTDELPHQLQERDHRIPANLPAGRETELDYAIRPLSRGEYVFGNLNLFLRTRYGLAERRLVLPLAQTVAVYPSIVQMRQFQLNAYVPGSGGSRRQPRPVTKSYEFDQIKEYVRGDDLRSINWKATARRGDIMVNRYEAERSQRIYCLIDKGRTMLMPFDGLSLLDYAINASLALSRVVLDRQDRAGLITFADKLGDIVPADHKSDQLRRIMDTLYRQREREGESDFDLLYYVTRRFLPGRSLLLLFTNFESNYALDRVLPVLRYVARSHRLVVVFFENTEVAALLHEAVPDIDAIYRQHTARRYVQERQLMALRLRRNGIAVILTRPEDLTGTVIERYAELKSRGI